MPRRRALTGEQLVDLFCLPPKLTSFATGHWARATSPPSSVAAAAPINSGSLCNSARSAIPAACCVRAKRSPKPRSGSSRANSALGRARFRPTPREPRLGASSSMRLLAERRGAHQIKEGAPGHRALARVVEQRAALRAIGLDPNWAEGVHPERFRKLAREGARFTAQHLRALSTLRRRATLVATALDTITRLTDDGVSLFDRAVGRMFRRAEVRARCARSSGENV